MNIGISDADIERAILAEITRSGDPYRPGVGSPLSRVTATVVEEQAEKARAWALAQGAS